MASKKKVSRIVGGFLIVSALIMAGAFVKYQIPKEEVVATLDQETVSLMELMGQLKESPEDAEVLSQIGMTFLKAEDWIRSESFFERATKAAPENSLYYSFLGLAQFQLGKYEESITSLEKSLALDNDPDTMLNLGIIYKYKLTDIAKANKLFIDVMSSKDASEKAKEAAQRELIDEEGE